MTPMRLAVGRQPQDFREDAVLGLLSAAGEVGQVCSSWRSIARLPSVSKSTSMKKLSSYVPTPNRA